MAKILCTGGAGFVGSHLCETLVNQGHEVQCLDNYFTGSEDNHVQGVDYIRGSTLDIKSLISVRPDIIYHLGEYSRVEQSFNDIEKVIAYNKSGTLKVLQFALNHNAKLVYAASSTKFGDGGENADASPYAWSKSSNVQMLNNFGKWYNLNYAIVYFYNVYGPREIQNGEYATLIAKFAKLAKAGEILPVVSPGTQQRNFTHVYDTVRAITLVGEHGNGDGYGIGASEAYTVLEVAEMFKSPITMLPEREGNRMTATVESAKTIELGWKPQHKLKDYIEAL